jgi:hypothetical protein
MHSHPKWRYKIGVKEWMLRIVGEIRFVVDMGSLDKPTKHIDFGARKIWTSPIGCGKIA